MQHYAIVESSGKQFWIEQNFFYDINALFLSPGDTFFFNRVLLLKKRIYKPNRSLSDHIMVGTPFLPFTTCSIRGVVVRHITGSKVKVYKMRPKKKTRKIFGNRLKLTRIFIEKIQWYSKLCQKY